MYDWLAIALSKDCSRGPHQVGSRCHSSATGEFTSADDAGTAEGAGAEQHRSEERKSSSKAREISRRNEEGYGVESSAFRDSVYQEAGHNIDFSSPDTIIASMAQYPYAPNGGYIGVLGLFPSSRWQNFYESSSGFGAFEARVRGGQVTGEQVVPEFFRLLLNYMGTVPANKIANLKGRADVYNADCEKNGVSAAATRTVYEQTAGTVGPADVQVLEHLASAVVGGMAHEGTPYSTIWAMSLLSGASAHGLDRLKSLATDYDVQLSAVEELFNKFAVDDRLDAVFAADNEVEQYKTEVKEWLGKHAAGADATIIEDETNHFVEELQRGRAVSVIAATALAAVKDHQESAAQGLFTIATDAELAAAQRNRAAIGVPKCVLKEDQALGTPDAKARISEGLVALELEDRETVGGWHSNTTFWAKTSDETRLLCKLNIHYGSAAAEEMAYDIDRVLGFNLVPPTVNIGGSFEQIPQNFNGVSAQTDANKLGLSGRFRTASENTDLAVSRSLNDENNGWLHRVLAFNQILQNEDLNSGNVMVSETGRMISIDNGAMMYSTGFSPHSFGGGLNGKALSDDVFAKLQKVDISAFRRTLLRHGFSRQAVDIRTDKLRKLVRDGFYNFA